MTALCVGAAGPVGGQEFGVLAIDPHEGPVGNVVEGFVDPEVVEESCITTIEETQVLFFDAATLTPGPVGQAWLDSGHLVGIPTTDPVEWLTALITPQFNVEPFPDTYEVLAATMLFMAMLSVAGGAPFGGDPGAITADYLAQTFILTFADIATQEPVGEISSFDPNTGIGQVNAPDVAPGLWAVVATCVEPLVTEESFLATVAVGATWLEDWDVPLNDDLGAGTFWTDPDGQEHQLVGFLDRTAQVTPWVAPEMFPELMVPQEGAGPWVDIFCIWDDSGQCHPDLRDLTLAELEALEDQGLLGELLGDEVPATPVGASPRFTG